MAQTVLEGLLNGFFVLTAWVLGIALAILVIALLSGPYRWARAIRAFVIRCWHAVAQALRPARIGRLDGCPRRCFQLGGAVVALYLLLIVSVSWISFLIVGVLLAAFEIFLQQIKPPTPDEDAARFRSAATRWASRLAPAKPRSHRNSPAS